MKGIVFSDFCPDFLWEIYGYKGKEKARFRQKPNLAPEEGDEIYALSNCWYSRIFIRFSRAYSSSLLGISYGLDN